MPLLVNPAKWRHSQLWGISKCGSTALRRALFLMMTSANKFLGLYYASVTAYLNWLHTELMFGWPPFQFLIAQGSGFTGPFSLNLKSWIEKLKALILGFYIMLNCGDMISTIDQGLVFSIQEATLAAGVSKYNMEELMLTTVYDNTSPYRNFTPRDSLYILGPCLDGGWGRVELIVRSIGAVIPRLWRYTKKM